MKRLAPFALGFLCAALVGILLANADWVKRHYLFSGYPDTISVFLIGEDEKTPVGTDRYTLACADMYGLVELNRRNTCFSLRGDYGGYHFTLTYEGSVWTFFLDNANDWYRTVVALTPMSDGSLLQTNVIYNANPPSLERFIISPQAENE